MIECRAVHIHDLRAADSEYPGSQELSLRFGTELILASRFCEKGLRLAILISDAPKFVLFQTNKLLY